MLIMGAECWHAVEDGGGVGKAVPVDRVRIEQVRPLVHADVAQVEVHPLAFLEDQGRGGELRREHAVVHDHLVGHAGDVGEAEDVLELAVGHVDEPVAGGHVAKDVVVVGIAVAVGVDAVGVGHELRDDIPIGLPGTEQQQEHQPRHHRYEYSVFHRCVLSRTICMSRWSVMVLPQGTGTNRTASAQTLDAAVGAARIVTLARCRRCRSPAGSTGRRWPSG